MPKIKSHSSAKKRFSFTAKGKVRATQANKRHRMRNRQQSQIVRQRGTTIVAKAEWATVKKLLPYG